MRQVTHVLLTRPPLIRFPKETSSLDLHVLGTPPAFVLSQDQTLNKKFNLLTHKTYFNKRIAGLNVFYIFCSFFKDQFISIASSDCYILSSKSFCVNTFFRGVSHVSRDDIDYSIIVFSPFILIIPIYLILL